MQHASGVLPGDVVRDPASTGEIIYLSLADDIPVDELEGIVQHVYATVEAACDGDHPALSVCVAWGPRLFNRLAAKPAGLDVN